MFTSSKFNSFFFAILVVGATIFPVVTFPQPTEAQSIKDIFEFARNPRAWLKGNWYWIVGEAVVVEQLTRCDRDPNLCRSKVLITNKAVEKITGICQPNSASIGRFIAGKLSTRGPVRKGVTYIYQYHDNSGYYFIINPFGV